MRIQNKPVLLSSLLAAMLVAIAIIVTDYFVSNMSFPLFDDIETLMIGGFSNKEHNLKEDDFSLDKLRDADDWSGKDDVMFVNTAYDISLADKRNSFNNVVGSQAVANRDTLLKFLRIVEKADYRYVFCDIRFEEGVVTPADSALMALVDRLPNFVFSTHREDDSYALDSRMPEYKAAMADYRVTAQSSFSRFELLQYGEESVPLRMYREIDGGTFSKWGPFYISNGHVSTNMPFIKFPYALLTDEMRDDGVVRYPYLSFNVLGFNDEVSLIKNMRDKIIVIGDFVNDTHQTYLGEVPGPIICYMAYRSLKEGRHYVNLLFVLICFVLYTTISFFLIIPWRGVELLKKRWLTSSFSVMFEQGLLMFLFKIFAFKVLDSSLIAIVPVAYFALIPFFFKAKRFIIKQYGRFIERSEKSTVISIDYNGGVGSNS